jgi:hypothetical protein
MRAIPNLVIDVLGLQAGEANMTTTCTTCGCTASEATANARAVGLQQEFESGMYTCCQIAEWADEQSLAWFEASWPEATHEDDRPTHDVTDLLELDTEAVLVRVRRRRPEVPWFRNPDDLSR